MKNIKTIALMSLSLTLLVSCGKDSGGSGGASGSESVVEEQQAQGAYRAIVRPMNNSLSGFLPSGATEINIDGDVIKVKTYLDDDAKVKHIQSIHTGTRCPSERDDLNGDGLVDINEAYQVVGEVLIPLDSDIETTTETVGIFPIGGGFTYSEEASLSKVESDVNQRVNQNLNLSGRIVLMHGVNATTKMPDSVATQGVMPRQESIPIACGILKRL